MKKSDFDRAIDELVRVKETAIDKLINDLIKPLEVKANPEDLIGKPFEQWTPQDLELLKKVYGDKEPNVLSNFVFKKTYERVKALEQEEL